MRQNQKEREKARSGIDRPSALEPLEEPFTWSNEEGLLSLLL